MAYLGIATDEARVLAGELRRGASGLDAILMTLGEAESLSDVASMAGHQLDQVRTDWELSASEITAAADLVEAFRVSINAAFLSWRWSMPAVVPVRTPVPTPIPFGAESEPATSAARWNATADMAWNEVRQDASHNSYAVPGGVHALFDLGVRTFELDIHRGAPAALGTNWLPWSSPEPVADDAPDWRVYHLTGDAASEYDFLSDGLRAVASLDTTEPLTVFVDNKDAFAGSHTPERFDQIVEAVLGDRLYRPSDLTARSPESASMHDVVERIGWPTVTELEGRILVILTDNSDGYLHRGSTAFVAGEPTFTRFEDELEHHATADHIFYNVSARGVDRHEISAVAQSGSVLRTYFNPQCVSIELGDEPVLPNYRAIDVAPDSETCGSALHAPPVDTPVPGPGG